MTQYLQQITRHFLELDALKQVQRKSYISGEPARLENSAEYSWHLAPDTKKTAAGQSPAALT